MPEIVCAPAQLKEISLPSLADYARGSIIRGGAADWEALVHPGALYHLQTDANDAIWSQNISLADGSWIGIAGNELLTVTAAGMFIFSGITGIWVQSGDIFGIDGSAGRIEFIDALPDLINFLDCKVGIGTSAPGQVLEVTANAAIIRLADANATTAIEATPYIEFGKNGGGWARYAYVGFGSGANDDFYIENESAGGHLLLQPGGGWVGIGRTPVNYLFEVYDDVNGYVTQFINDGDNINRRGIIIQCGADDGAAVGETYYVAALDGDGGWTGGLKTVNGVFQLVDLSDERRKTNIKDTQVQGLNVINRLKVRDYNWKTQPEGPVMTGFVAQEAQEVYPDMISETDDGTLMTSRAMLIPVLVKAIQEQQKQIEALESKIRR